MRHLLAGGAGRTRRLRFEPLEARLAPAAGSVIDYSSGFTPAEMIGGWGAGYAEGQLLLTNGPNEGTVAWNRARVDVRAFRTWFVFQQTDSEGTGTPSRGDGFTFVLSSRQRTWAGTTGGGLGYEGLTDSVAVKFDLVDNAGEGSNSVGVFTGGVAPTTPGVGLVGTGIDLHSGRAYRADVAYDGAGLTLTLTDVAEPSRTWSHTFPVDIPAALGSSTGFVGFTAGTGMLAARQAIHAWEYAVVEPAAGVNRPPAVTTAARAIPDSPTTVVLGGGATDDAGTDGLTYTWTVVATPAGAAPVVTPIDSPEYPAAARVTLDRVGAYTFLLTARDAEGEIASSAVGYVVAPTVTSLDVDPPTSTIRAGGTAQLRVIPLDQFGDPMTLPGPVAWQVVSGPGGIDANGLYTAPADAAGAATIRAVVPTSSPHITAETTLTVVPATTPADPGVDFGDGFDGAVLDRNGSAQVAGNRLRLADGPYQAGSAYAPEPVDVRGFSTSFRFRVGDAPGRYGDGFTFVLQNAGATAVGAAGGGLGYQGITDSVAVKLDLVDNAGEGTDSTGVYTGGAAPTVPADTFVTQYPFDFGIHLNTGDVYEVTLSYSGGTLLVDVRSLDAYYRRFTQAYAVDIPAAVGGPTARVGFTAGTGELYAPIDILEWTYTPTVDAAGDAAPILVQPPRTPLSYVRARSVELSALAADDGGEANLTYTWRVTFAPQGAGPVRFSENGTNAARTTTATFAQVGRYGFELLVTDASGNTTRPAETSVEMAAVPGAFVVTPAAPVVVNGAVLSIRVETLDQFGDPMPYGTGSWGLSVTGPGGINALNHEYLAPPAGTGPVTIRASNGTITGTATVMLLDRPPATGTQYARGFDLSSGVVTNGSAVRTYPWVRLTGTAPDQAGSVFTTAPLDVTGFVARVQFRPGQPDDRPDQGAGMAFVLQAVGPRALGASGSGLGYQGIARSVAVAFDSVANAIGLATDGAAPVGTVPLAGTGIELTQGHDLQADLFYDGRTLHVTLTDVATGAAAAAAFEVDIPAAVGGDTAFAGFTASTGPTVDQYASQVVSGFQYRAVAPGSPNFDPLVVRPARVIAPAFYSPPSLPLSVQLVARAEDDGGPFDLRYKWELVSAPAGANPRVDPLGTHGAQLDQPGTYVFRVTVTDARGASVTDEATYVLDPANWLRG